MRSKEERAKDGKKWKSPRRAGAIRCGKTHMMGIMKGGENEEQNFRIKMAEMY